jgi:EAL domain-containing protein (putative c-di-GMP-specific phosphodiesterase class I)
MVWEPEAGKDIAARLISALQQDEFILYTQSIIPLGPPSKDRPFQEIFIRFKEEDAKLLPPGTFFPVLAECHLLPYLDRWVVNRLARWVRAALRIRPKWQVPRSNVNVSTETLVDVKFGQYVRKYVEDSYLSKGAIGFEITWDSAIENQASLLRLMAELRPHACGFTLSGFDGSERSFAVLKAFAPNFVKIDSMTVDPAKLPEIQRRCNPLGSKTIVEHVENAKVLEQLRRAKIDFGQGFQLSPVEPL